MGLQLGFILFTLLSIIMLMWCTFLFDYGLLGLLCSRFQPIFIVWPVYFSLTIAFRVYRISIWSPIVQLEENRSYRAIFIIHRLVALTYYVIAVRTSQILAESRFYRSSGWIG